MPGVELSTDYEGREVHILGYYIDENNHDFLARLHDFVDGRDIRNEKMVALLRKEGFDITMKGLYEKFPDSVITRAHFARYLVDNGFVKNRETVFAQYLGDNCRCYVPREKITPFEAVRLIHLGGGLAFFAHPVLCHMNHNKLRSFVRDLKAEGLDGMEAVYSMNTPGDESNMLGLAHEFGLLVSGGSDFHGANKPHIRLGSGKGNLQIPYDILVQIKEHRQNPKLV